MRIAFILGSFPSLSETFILNQITGLIDRGHEVDIYALRGPSTQPKIHPIVEKYRLLKRVYYVPKIPKNYIWLKIKGLGLLLANFHKAPLTCLRWLNYIKHSKKGDFLRLLYAMIPTLGKEPYDIIHCQFGSYALESLMLHRIGALQGKLITSFRGRDISRYIKHNGSRVYDQLFQAGNCFLTVSELFRKRLIELGCDSRKIIVHRSGIDCRKFAFTPRSPHPDGRIQLVTTGRLVEKKGIEYSIRAVSQLNEIYTNLEYIIIGDGYLREHLQQLIYKLGVSHVVKLLGWKSQQEVIELLKVSQIFIAPSITAYDGDQEGIPNTIKEAMAMGLPVVATRHAGIPELVEDGVSGFLVPERDVDALARKLGYLLKHPEIWPSMGKAGRERVTAYYDIYKLNQELVDIYQKTISEKSAADIPLAVPVYKAI